MKRISYQNLKTTSGLSILIHGIGIMPCINSQLRRHRIKLLNVVTWSWSAVCDCGLSWSYSLRSDESMHTLSTGKLLKSSLPSGSVLWRLTVMLWRKIVEKHVKPLNNNNGEWANDKTNTVTCTPSKASDQPWHLGEWPAFRWLRSHYSVSI